MEPQHLLHIIPVPGIHSVLAQCTRQQASLEGLSRPPYAAADHALTRSDLRVLHVLQALADSSKP